MQTITTDLLRSSQDTHLHQQLLNDSTVENVNNAITRQADQGMNNRVRRQLLSTSVRLSKRMSPVLARLAVDCAQRLDITIPIELYAYSNPQFNAACVKPEDGRLFIMFSSSLLDAFDEGELRFVMGHELGHYLYGHHDIPIGYILRGQQQPSPELALTLTRWSRYAEISADRAGAHCTQNFNAVARALFKLASGVTSSIVSFQLEDFLQQVDDMQLENADTPLGNTSQDWFLTHPFSPLRVKALQFFHQSILANTEGVPVDTLEMNVENLMSFMEPNYLDGHTDTAKHMRNLLFAGLLLVANADSEISDSEIAVFETFFGRHKYSEQLNLQQLEKELSSRVQRVNESASLIQKLKVINDICTIATVDKPIGTEEYQVIKNIASLLQLPLSIIEQFTPTNVDLD